MGSVGLKRSSGNALDLSFGNFRLELSLDNCRLGSFVWHFSFGIIRLGTFVWELSFGTSGLSNSAPAAGGRLTVT